MRRRRSVLVERDDEPLRRAGLAQFVQRAEVAHLARGAEGHGVEEEVEVVDRVREVGIDAILVALRDDEPELREPLEAHAEELAVLEAARDLLPLALAPPRRAVLFSVR